MTKSTLPLIEVPDLAGAGAAARWRLALGRRMDDVGLSTADSVRAAGEFDIGGFDDAFSRLRKGDQRELRRWFVVDGGERARCLARVLEITDEELVDELLKAQSPPSPNWHSAFPGVEATDVHVPPPVPDLFLEVGAATPTMPLVEAVSAWVEQRNGPLRVAKPVILWVEGPPGSGRRTLARALGSLELGPVTEATPSEGWHRWLRCVEAPHIAVIDTAQRIAAVGRDVPGVDGLPDQVICKPAQWGPGQLHTLIDRLAVVQDGLSARAVEAAMRVVDAWRSASEHLAGVERPADLIELLGVLRDEPERSDAPRSAALHGQWRAIQRRGGSALAPWDHLLLAGFWCACWLDPDVSLWWRPSVPQAERAMSIALAEQSRHQTVDHQLDELSRSGRGRAERVALLRRSLAARGPVATLAGLVDASVLARKGRWFEAVDPDGARRWVAVGLTDRAGRTLDGHWARLADVDWPIIAGELVRAGWTISQLILATKGAPDWARADVARGLIHGFDASAISRPSRRERTVLRRAWSDATWTLITGLTQLKGGVGDLAHNAFRDSAVALGRVSHRFADDLPRLNGPHLSRALEALISPQAVAMSEGWHYTIGEVSTGHPVIRMSAGEPDDPQWARLELDLALARLVPNQCATARVDELPGASLVGEADDFVGMSDQTRQVPRSIVARRRFIRKMPATWWDAIAEMAEGGDGDAIALLGGHRAPLAHLLATDRPDVLVVPLTMDDEELAATVEAAGPVVRQIVRAPDPASAEWSNFDRVGIVLDAGPPVELRLIDDEDRLWGDFADRVPDRLRRRWLAALPSSQQFRDRWERAFDHTSGRFGEMTAKASSQFVECLIRRALGVDAAKLETEVFGSPPKLFSVKAPALWTVLEWATRRRVFWALDVLVSLPLEWRRDARLGGRWGQWAVSFPTTSDTRFAGKQGCLSWARNARWGCSATELMHRWRALDDIAHAAAVALYDMGHRRALEERWTMPGFGDTPGLDITSDWHDRAQFIAALERLPDVGLPIIKSRLDALPVEGEAWVRRFVAAIRRNGPAQSDWTTAEWVLDDTGRPGERPSVTFAQWIDYVRYRRLAQSTRLLRDLTADGEEGAGAAQEGSEERRLAVAVFLVGGLATVGLPPTLGLPPRDVADWLTSLVPGETNSFDPLGEASAANLMRRRRTAARALVERGDRRPITQWIQDESSREVPFALVRETLLKSPAALAEWLPRLSLEREAVFGWLVGPAVEWQLPGLSAAWHRAGPDTRRRLALKWPAHPLARTWLAVLADEAWDAGCHRESALWSWLIHTHHADDDPRSLRAVEHWALADPEPFDRRVFRVKNKVLVGGGGALVEMMETWARRSSWCRREEAVRRVHAQGVYEWPRPNPWPNPFSPTQEQLEATRLPWLDFGWHEGLGGARLQQSLVSWLRAIDATDIRDSAIFWGGSEWDLGTDWALAWWVEDADDLALRSKLEEVLLDIDEEDIGVQDARVRRASVLLREWYERDPESAVDWMVDRCTVIFEGFDLPDDEEWFWILDHQEVGLDALVQLIAGHRPGVLEEIWCSWWSVASTAGRRRWVLRHLAWRSTWNGPDAARAGVLVRQWALDGRSGQTR